MNAKIENWLLRVFVALYATTIFFVIVHDINSQKKNNICLNSNLIDLNEIQNVSLIVYDNSDNGIGKTDTVLVDKNDIIKLLDTKLYSQNNDIVIKGMFFPLYEIDVTLKNKDNIKIVYSFMNGEVRKIRNKTIEHKCQMENPEIIETLFERIL